MRRPRRGALAQQACRGAAAFAQQNARRKRKKLRGPGAFSAALLCGRKILTFYRGLCIENAPQARSNLQSPFS
jgi:hypothetical protein